MVSRLRFHGSAHRSIHRKTAAAALLLLTALICTGCTQGPFKQPESTAATTVIPESDSVSNQAIADAFAAHSSGVQVSGEGTVERILSDDNNGSRHQRFVLKLESGQTLLVVHNIDLAPRLDSLQVGDAVAFFGEYEYNGQGGVLHWTHLDPDGSHAAGWLQHNGVVYQ